MFRCLSWCSSCFGSGQREYRRGAAPRRIRDARLEQEDELVIYDELNLEEAALRRERVREAAVNAERRDLAVSLRDESLVARITHALNAPESSDMETTEISLNEDGEDGTEATSSSVPNSSTFVKTLHTLRDAKVVPVVVESLWNATRHRWRKRETTRLLGLFQLAIATALGESAQNELYSIILDLPPAVMGDTAAQQTSRVLVDVSRDVREEMMHRRAALPPAGRRQVDSAVAAFDAQLKNLELTGAQIESDRITLVHPASKPFKPGSIDPHIALYFDIMISMLLEVSEFDRFRILLSQLVMSKHLPADTTLRASVLELIFPSRPSTPQTPPQTPPLFDVLQSNPS